MAGCRFQLEGGLPDLGQRRIDRRFEPRAMVTAIASPRSLRARAASICVAVRRSRSIMIVAEHHDGAGHGTEFILGASCRNGSGRVAVRQAFHHAGETPQRPRDGLSNPEAERQAEDDGREADLNDRVARMLLRTVQSRAGLGALLVRAADIRVGAADQKLGVGIDAGDAARNLSVGGDPGLKRPSA